MIHMDNWVAIEGMDSDNTSDDDEDMDDWEEDGGEGSDDNDDDDSSGCEIEDEIVDKFILTFHNGDYDAEFDNTLCHDRNRRPCLFSTQASYNKPYNWVERNRIGLERVKGQLLTFINTSLLTSFSLRLTHDFGFYADNDEPIVWHDPIIDEYWDEIRRQVDACGIQIANVEFTNVEMTKESLAALVDIFHSGRATNSSTSIAFDNTNLCAEGIKWLSKLVDVSSKMKSLCLVHNQLDNMDSARCLSMSLKSHTCINRLVLGYCNLGSNPEILSLILQSDISHIHLHWNNIDSLGAVKIAEYLEDDPPIEKLDLAYNRLNDDDVILIFLALKRNTNLKTLCIHSNIFTSIGVKALLTCVFDSSNLNAISESNHTLGKMFVFAGNDTLTGCINRMIGLDLTEKILFALQDKESLLDYLANVPVGLIPDVLAFVQHQLNIVYCIMRWWNMPMLYLCHHDYCV